MIAVDLSAAVLGANRAAIAEHGWSPEPGHVALRTTVSTQLAADPAADPAPKPGTGASTGDRSTPPTTGRRLQPAAPASGPDRAGIVATTATVPAPRLPPAARPV